MQPSERTRGETRGETRVRIRSEKAEPNPFLGDNHSPNVATNTG